ncbi:ABC transporter ATP-binding protein [Flavobacterium crocinum]|uniref:ABC transporter ATP-binding protein n=1 Tax=Flavobacterium crocinum TaxID=2183896 RepID=UPI001F0C0E8E|nr:ABC transporter ATP-binding protein [Flavobacterium crocinum]
MKHIILKAENISKQYRLGQVGTGTLSHDLNRWWHKIRGKEDPYLKIGEINDRSTKGTSDYVWALQDINFEVERGEVLGIIGKNGAGKSTLLKILSKVTAPTTGSIKSRGRIASLLEVGTGFNGEMTGRENIFLNGAILGMTKKEITSKLDEIIEFSGCERYIDTPVKRYSSGMTVRLAFAVAAFLEPEILVVDEVLAVGDAEFQKKAIGKMQDISKGEGRTVLFVSHNMAAVKSLCTRGIIIENGTIKCEGNIDYIIEKYFDENQIVDDGRRIGITDDSLNVFKKWFIKNKNSFDIFSDENTNISFEFISNENLTNCELGLVIRNYEGKILLGCNSRDFGGDYFNIKNGKYIFSFELNLPIIDGKYEIDVILVSNNVIIDQWVSETYLIVKNKFDSVLDRKWRGELNLKTFFRYDELC